MELKDVQTNWNRFGKTDPFWAILADPVNQYGWLIPEMAMLNSGMQTHHGILRMVGISQQPCNSGRYRWRVDFDNRLRNKRLKSWTAAKRADGDVPDDLKVVLGDEALAAAH